MWRLHILLITFLSIAPQLIELLLRRESLPAHASDLPSIIGSGQCSL